MLEEKVLNTIQKYELIKENDKIVLGVSGGPDSLAMLNILNSFKSKMKFNIYVAHINHGIRENAKKDEEFVRKFCEKIDVECYVLNTNIKIGSNIVFKIAPETIDVIAYFGLPSALIIEFNVVPIIIKGRPIAIKYP